MAQSFNPKHGWHNGHRELALTVAQAGPPASKAAPRSQNFIEKLQEALVDEANQSFIHWDVTGRSVTIPDRKGFTAHVLKEVCQSENFDAFTRQLNNYGFRKIPSRNKDSSDRQRCEFVHDDFRRDQPLHYSQIRRKAPGVAQESDVPLTGSPAPTVAEPSQPARAFASVPLTSASEIDKLKRRLELMENRLGQVEALARQALYDKATAEANVADLTAQIAALKQSLIPPASPLLKGGMASSFRVQAAASGWSTDGSSQSIPRPAASSQYAQPRGVDQVLPMGGPVMPPAQQYSAAMPQSDFQSGQVLDHRLTHASTLCRHLQNDQNQDLAAAGFGLAGNLSASWPVRNDGSGGPFPAYMLKGDYVRPEHPPRGPAGGTSTA